MLTVTAYDPNDQEYDTLETVPPRMMSDFAYIYLSQDYNNSGTVTVKLYWAEKYPHSGFAIFKASQSGMVIDTLSISEVIVNGVDTLSSALITSLDSTGVYLDDIDYVDFRYTFSAAGAGSTQTFFLNVDGFAQQYAGNADSLEATVNVTTDDITIEEFNTATAVSGAFVYIDNGTTRESGFTNVNGIFNPTADLDYTYDIYVYKMGYRPLKVQHTNTPIYDDEIWYGDVQLLGDAIAESGDTLTILPGTRVWIKHTSSVWNYANGASNKTELMAYGDNAHLHVFGTEEEPVMFRPSPGGSGDFQWAGFFAKNGGNFYANYATFEKCDGVWGIQGGSGPGRCKLVHTRHIGNQGVAGDWRNAKAVTGWFQMDTCYVEGRALWFENDDSCWARACTLNGTYESFYVYTNDDYVDFEDCYLYDYTSRGGRNYGRADFDETEFDGTGPAAYNYSRIKFDDSKVDANSGPYGLYVGNNAPLTSGRTTTFQRYSTYGVYLLSDVDFGNGIQRHNCFITDDATYTFYGSTGLHAYADYCYFDTLKYNKGLIVSHDYEDSICIPDTSLYKVTGQDGKPIMPRVFALGDAVPNPFNSTVAIEFDVPKDAEVTVEIYNLLGNKVTTLVDEEMTAGRYKAIWDSRDNSGRTVPSGTYMYRMRAVDEEFEETKKMTLIK
ncbi:hypothetical protein DRQ36_11395 [bacterium]|nr:MAG: hypothetical protein DRQ36_11395 [bacterium]